MSDELYEAARQVWSHALGGPVTDTTDFFLAGGHSFLALDVTADLSDACDAEVPLRLVFDFPTFGEYVRAVRDNVAGGESSDSDE